jgi:RNA polymerase sigma-70 factor (ECF subfamily)
MQDADVEASIEAAQRGAVELLYRQEGDRLWRALRLTTGNSDTASDALAEAFAQLIARGSAVRNPVAWVWRSSFRIAAGEMQRSRRDDPLPEDLPTDAPDPLVDLERGLRTLTPHQRAAVILADYAGWSHAEIARTLRSTPAAVAVHVHRARRRLRTLMEERDA